MSNDTPKVFDAFRVGGVGVCFMEPSGDDSNTIRFAIRNAGANKPDPIFCEGDVEHLCSVVGLIREAYHVYNRKPGGFVRLRSRLNANDPESYYFGLV